MGLPNPITRKETYLNAAAGGSTSGDLPTPITREEEYLKAIAEGGGGGGGGMPIKSVGEGLAYDSETGELSATGMSVAIDDHIDSTSVHPVQNKVIAEALDDKADSSDLATVATSGSYNDLTNKPTIPEAQVNADWTAVSGVAQILHKPTLGTAAAKNSTNAVTSGSADLVESGAVKSAIDTSTANKADKVSGGTENNFAALDANGNLKDSGHKHSDYLTQHQDITGKADKVSGGTTDNFAALDANGNLKDSGHKHSDYLTQHQDITGKADKVTSATSGNFAGLDGNGNLTDSGIASGIVPATASASNKLATMNDIPGGGGLGTKLTSTVSGDTLTFTDAGITASAVIDGPYIQGVLIGLLELDDSTTGTLVYTLEDDSADGATAYIWVRS